LCVIEGACLDCAIKKLAFVDICKKQVLSSPFPRSRRRIIRSRVDLLLSGLDSSPPFGQPFQMVPFFLTNARIERCTLYHGRIVDKNTVVR